MTLEADKPLSAVDDVTVSASHFVRRNGHRLPIVIALSISSEEYFSCDFEKGEGPSATK